MHGANNSTEHVSSQPTYLKQRRIKEFNREKETCSRFLSTQTWGQNLRGSHVLYWL